MNLLLEITRRQRERQEQQRTQTQTQTAEPTDTPDLSAFQRGMDDQLQGTQNVPQKRDWASLPDLKQSTAAATRQKTSSVTLPAEAGEKMSFLQSLGLEDEITDAEAAATAGVELQHGQRQHYDVAGAEPEPEQPTTAVAVIQTLPDVVNKEIAKQFPVEPEWHQVKHLPGYLAAAIRAMGRQVFGTFTKTKIEDIQVVAAVGGGGPNSEAEMNAVAKWLRDNGERDTDGEMNFQRSIPDYGADFEIYTYDKFTFMIVQDDYGNYVYSWPSADNKSFTQNTNRRLTRSQNTNRRLTR